MYMHCSSGSILSTASDKNADSHSTAAPENAAARADTAGNFILPALIPTAAAKISAEVAAPMSNSSIALSSLKSGHTFSHTIATVSPLSYELNNNEVTFLGRFTKFNSRLFNIFKCNS